jgi:hypothetical protein
MEKQYIVSEQVKERIISFSNNHPKQYPRIIIQINQRRYGWLISISGPDEQVPNFIDELKSSIDLED